MKHISKKKTIGIIFITLFVIFGIIFFFNINKLRTILSFKEVNDYPLYYMKYFGAYNLDFSIPKEYMPKDATVISNNVNMMCSSFYVRNEKGEPLLCRNLDYTLTDHPITALFTDAPGKNASFSMADLYYLGYNKNNPPKKSLFKSGPLLQAPRITIDGFNEYGLAAAILTVPSAKLPYDPEKPTTDEVGMMRLILDDAKTVEEAIDIINDYNIIFHEAASHFMISDATGDSAVIEFIGGEIQVHRENTDWQICTNFILSEDLGEKWGLDRYNIATARLEEKKGILTKEEAMELLSDIKQDGTIWSVVYNLKTGEANVVMGKNYDDVNNFDLDMNNE